MEVAIEIKSSSRVYSSDCKGLNALAETNTIRRRLLVSFEKEPKIIEGNIEGLPWEHFLQMLWAGEII